MKLKPAAGNWGMALVQTSKTLSATLQSEYVKAVGWITVSGSTAANPGPG